MDNMLSNGEFFISDDRRLLNLPAVYDYLHENMYWAEKLAFDTFVRSVRNSAVCLGVYVRMEGTDSRQIGFARVVSDRTTFAYLTDVFIHEDYRGLGLSKLLLESVMTHPDLQGLRRFLLVTEDAQGLYAPYGFQPLGEESGHWMQIFNS